MFCVIKCMVFFTEGFTVALFVLVNALDRNVQFVLDTHGHLARLDKRLDAIFYCSCLFTLCCFALFGSGHEGVCKCSTTSQSNRSLSLRLMLTKWLSCPPFLSCKVRVANILRVILKSSSAEGPSQNTYLLRTLLQLLCLATVENVAQFLINSAMVRTLI